MVQVAEPWAWRKYYPQDWISFVKKKHCRYTIELRNASGGITAQYELDSESLQVHPERDVAALALSATSALQYGSAEEDQKLHAVKLSPSLLTPMRLVTVAGYALRDDESVDDQDSDSSNDGHRIQIPEATAACNLVTRFGNKQAFLKTGRHVLQEGMCGGGVFCEHDRDVCFGELYQGGSL